MSECKYCGRSVEYINGLRDRVKELEYSLEAQSSLGDEKISKLEEENARLHKVVDAARKMRDAKLGRGFKKACDDFDLVLQELDKEKT